MQRILFRRIVAVVLCVIGLLAVLTYFSAFRVVQDAYHVMSLEGVTGTALDSYASDLRTEKGAWGKATIIPLVVLPQAWDTSSVWVWYSREVFSPDGNLLSYANNFAKWTMERKQGKWRVTSISERP